MGATFWKGIYTKLITPGGIEFQDGRLKTQGSGSPEGVVTASVGSEYTDTSTGVLYLKQSGSGNTGWGANVNPTLKDIIDYSKPLGEVFFLPENRFSEFTFDPLNPRDYFPALNLAMIEGNYVDCSKINFPDDWVDYMNSINIAYLEGLSGGVTAWVCSVTSVDVTFPNTISANAVLAALAEDATIAGGTYSRKLRLSGDSSPRTISTINLATRVVSLVSTPGVSGSISVTIPAYVGDSDTQCRIYAIKGESLMAPNDPDGYFIMNLRTRGYFQGHRMNRLVSGIAEYTLENSAGGSQYASGGSFFNGTRTTTGDPVTDGTNGTPLVRKITHGPAYTLIPYMWCGG